MLKRFKISLFQPKQIASLRTDSKLMTTAFFIILSLLASIPLVVSLLSNTGLDYNDKLAIRNKFRDIDIPYKIENYELVKNEDFSKENFVLQLSEGLYVVFTDEEQLVTNLLNFDTYIVVSKNTVYSKQSIYEHEILKYNENDLFEEFSFEGAKSDELSFWNSIFPVINNKIKKIYLKKNIVNSIAAPIIMALMLLLLSSLIAFFQRMRLANKYSYSKIFKLTIYSFAPYVVLELLGQLYNIQVLSFVGIIITYIYVSTVSQTLLRE